VLRDPRSNTGAIGLRTNKFEPLRHGPYVVDEQETHGEERTNTIICREVNELGRYHRFHHDTLTIFLGTMEQAKRLAQLDNLEWRIVNILAITGSTAVRTDLIFHASLEARYR